MKGVGELFQAQGTAHVKAWRPERAWCVLELDRLSAQIASLWLLRRLQSRFSAPSIQHWGLGVLKRGTPSPSNLTCEIRPE